MIFQHKNHYPSISPTNSGAKTRWELSLGCSCSEIHMPDTWPGRRFASPLHFYRTLAFDTRAYIVFTTLAFGKYDLLAPHRTGGMQRHLIILLSAIYDIFQHKNFYISISPALNDIALFNDLLQNFMSVVCQNLKPISLRGCFFSGYYQLRCTPLITPSTSLQSLASSFLTWCRRSNVFKKSNPS